MPETKCLRREASRLYRQYNNRIKLRVSTSRDEMPETKSLRREASRLYKQYNNRIKLILFYWAKVLSNGAY